MLDNLNASIHRAIWAHLLASKDEIIYPEASFIFFSEPNATR